MTALILAAVSLTTNTIIGLAMLGLIVVAFVLLICLKKNVCGGDEAQTADNSEEFSVAQPKEETAAEIVRETPEKKTAVENETAPEQDIEVNKDAEAVSTDETVATISDSRPVLNIPIGKKLTFAEKILKADDANKEIYNMLKNEIMSYKKVSNRITKTIDVFKFKSTYLAKISIAGKTVKLHLALDPNEFAATKYHQQDLGEKKKYEFVPLALKVKSERSKKYAVELITEVMGKAGLEKNGKYLPTDYVSALEKTE